MTLLDYGTDRRAYEILAGDPRDVEPDGFGIEGAATIGERTGCF